MKNPKTVYLKLIEFEEQAASIYLGMASHFYPQNPELSALWLEMGMQEKQHAGLLQFCIAEGLLVETVPTEAQLRAIESAFGNLANRAADPALNINGAFQIAAEMEMSEVNGIYCYLTAPLHSSMYLLRKKIMASMPDHLERLQQEGRKYGVPEDLLKDLGHAAANCQ
jgi:hypothetical protein